MPEEVYMVKNRKTFLLGPYPPPYGGIATFVQAFVSHLKRLNRPYELHVFGDFPDAMPLTFGAVWRAFASISHRDVCFDHSAFSLGLCKKPLLALLLLKILKRFRWVVVIHNGSIPTRYASLSFADKIGLWLTVWLANDLIVISAEVQTWFTQKFKRKRPVHLMSSLLPLTESVWVEFPPEFAEFRAKHERVVCSIGIFIPLYGFQQVVEAVEQLRQSDGLKIGVVLIDGGVSMDTTYKEQVLANRQEWVLVLEKLPYPVLSQILRNSDVFVRALQIETYGLSRIEALWNGIPVVATTVGETRGMLLFEYGDIVALRQQIEHAFTIPEQEIAFWADSYYHEAEENLQRWLEYLP